MPRNAWRLAAAAALLALTACGGGGGHYARTGGYHYENGPGPANDPWGPYITEAATTYRIPDRWIRAVMRQESGGHQYLDGRPITSSSGAAGLMQILPSTYEKLRVRYSLGDDPYDPHDNIMGGAALIRELYNHYGSPDFLAAYNAGTRRMDAYLAGENDLPEETIAYVAAAAPELGDDPPMTGRLAFYGRNNSGYMTASSAMTVPVSSESWAVQVGAFPESDLARAAVATARSRAPDTLQTGMAYIGVTQHEGETFYRARITGLSQMAAMSACNHIQATGADCWAVPPGQ